MTSDTLARRAADVPPPAGRRGNPAATRPPRYAKMTASRKRERRAGLIRERRKLDHYLYQRLEKLLAESYSHWRLPAGSMLSDTENLLALSRHHNGYIRQIALRLLGNRQAIAALPALVERLNDWAEPVRRAARQGVRALLCDAWAPQFVACLADICRLNQCRRADHADFVEEIIDFLLQPQNQPALLHGLASPDRRTARQALHLLITRRLFSAETIFRAAARHADPIVRSAAADYLQQQAQPVDARLLSVLLRDHYAPIRQRALQYVIERRLALPVSLHQQLLLDNSTLVRRRACRLLVEQDGDPHAFYLSVPGQPACSARQKSGALSGLNEQRYPGIVALAKSRLGADAPALYRSALQIVAQHRGDDAGDDLLAALHYPSGSVAKTALRLFLRHGIRISLDDLQRGLERAPSPTHIRCCYRLAQRLNKWDWLIFLLRNADRTAEALTGEHLGRWENSFNRAGIAPTDAQRRQLTALTRAAPGARDLLRWLPAGQ